MDSQRRRPTATLLFSLLLVGVTAGLLPRVVVAQSLAGALIGTVKDGDGGALSGAIVRIASPALIGSPVTVRTNQRGQLRFLVLPPGLYVLDVEFTGFTAYHEEGIRIGSGGTIERTVVLKLSGVAESIVVQGAGSRIEARDPGFASRFGPADFTGVPTRRTSMFDFLRAAPGVSPTSPGSGTNTTVSAFGSGTNENQFLIDGTNTTCPCNGISRSEPGIDFIQEIQIQSVGASAEFGNVQGAVINVVTRQGSARFLYDASFYSQTASLTSQPARLAIPGTERRSGYERVKYRDVTTTLGGPGVRDRLWFFGGYQHLRDYDSQPGTDATFPRMYEQDKIFAKLTWRLAPAWQLVQSLHDEFWVNPDQPTIATPFEATLRRSASVPAITFGDLTHTSSANTVWDVRVGRFVYDRADEPTSGNRMTIGRFDRATRVSTGAPQTYGGLTLIRTTGKATVSHYRVGLLGADHQLKIGTQIERGEGHGRSLIPGGVRFVDDNALPFRAISSEPTRNGGLFITAAAFASDAITVGDRLTITAGVRFDHSRAISQDLHAIDDEGRYTDRVIHGLGTLYTWNLLSPRLGVTAKLTADGRTMMRGSYGRFSQGVLTGEFSGFHPGVSATRTDALNPATGEYVRTVSVVDPKVNLKLDAQMRAPRTDEYSIGVDREVARELAVAIAYVRKNGSNFIGWMDVGGEYQQETRTLGGYRVPVLALVTPTGDRRFLLTNPPGYSLMYDGLVTAVEKRLAHGWQAFGSYTFSKASGLQASSGTSAAGAQSSTVALPSTPFGLDPNDLTNARGRLANDRPHMLRVMATLEVPRTGFVVAGSLQHFSGKPWAATAQVDVVQGDQRVQLEPRGSRRLASQTLLDLRLSRAISISRVGRVELLVDVLNALNGAAEEGLATDNLFSANFGKPSVFMDPRRAMLGVRLTLGR